MHLLSLKRCQDTSAASDEPGERDGSEKASKSKKRLDMVRWVAAFQAYALAAEATEVHHDFAFAESFDCLLTTPPVAGVELYLGHGALAHLPRDCRGSRGGR